MSISGGRKNDKQVLLLRYAGPGISCASYAVQKSCNMSILTNSTDPHVAVIGGYCASSCGRCQPGTRACVDLIPPGEM